MSVYELHIRDFSIHDPQVSEQRRGKYAAFSENGLGMQHLKVATLSSSQVSCIIVGCSTGKFGACLVHSKEKSLGREVF